MDNFDDIRLGPVGRCNPTPNNTDCIAMTNDKEDTMKQPDYYKNNGLSPIDAFKQGLMSREQYTGFIIGNIIKYVVRAEHKEDPVKDLNKAKDYINFYLELLDDDKVKNVNIATPENYRDIMPDDEKVDLCEENKKLLQKAIEDAQKGM